MEAMRYGQIGDSGAQQPGFPSGQSSSRMLTAPSTIQGLAREHTFQAHASFPVLQLSRLVGARKGPGIFFDS